MTVTKKIQSVVEKNGSKGKFYICVIEGKEYMGFDSRLVGMVDKEAEIDLIEKEDGKRYIKLPGAPPPTFKKPWSGGKSDAELALTAKTMSASYAKDLVVAMVSSTAPEMVIPLWSSFFDAIYSKITGPVQDRPEPQPPKPILPPDAFEKKEIQEPPKASDSRTCGGANPKLKGKKVTSDFCQRCFFKSKCDVYLLKENQEPEPTAKPYLPDRDAFYKKIQLEMGRIGMQVTFNALAQMGYEYANEVPAGKESEVLKHLASYPDKDSKDD